MAQHLTYEEWLQVAASFESKKMIPEAVNSLRRAEKLTNDEDELAHLRLWVERLEKI